MADPQRPSRSTTGRLQPRKRAAVACYACHARKVRCSIPQTGLPCNNCALDNVDCRPRQRRRAANLRQQPPASSRQASIGPIEVDAAAAEDDSESYAPFVAHFSHHGNTDNDLNSPSGTSTITCSPLYGDPQSIGLVADICQPERQGKTGHFLVTSMASSNLDPDASQFLKSRGVFDLPPPEVCKQLVRIYCDYVHPFFPVLDTISFLNTLEKNELEKLSLHLLWSVFLAAANFADTKVLQATGFTSRKTMKKSMFSKAKLLYDADYERDKVILIQAVLLMGFWYADTEDRIGPWHWNGVAIGLCTSIGLHRQTNASLNRGHASPSMNKGLWQQLWWACFFRETWLSAGMGRPMRVDLAYCNTPKPDDEGCDGASRAGLTNSTNQTYFSGDNKTLGILWRDLIDITVIQSEVLSVQHRVPTTRHSRPDVERIERRYRAFQQRFREIKEASADQILLLHVYHAELFLDSGLLTLYRPFMLVDLGLAPWPSSPARDTQEWLACATQKSRMAALHTNNILGNMMGSDMMVVSQALICIALVPTLQTHLLHASSSDVFARQLGCHHLALCMMAVEELRKTYFGAEILFRLFTRALEIVQARQSGLASTSMARPGTDREEPHPGAEGAEPSPRNSTPWNLGDNLEGLYTSTEPEDADIDFILSQCMFPDFVAVSNWDGLMNSSETNNPE
ncbi:fungal specific transcription [Colletotrichum incanum]|uniref:Fungal specific transcription n=1 Tax=Colletotrichum incanum TaxID=1573173 RepID=A0A166ZSA0_COLIC|nr:fungal specific transcription [Colletotrichum incanum]